MFRARDRGTSRGAVCITELTRRSIRSAVRPDRMNPGPSEDPWNSNSSPITHVRRGARVAPAREEALLDGYRDRPDVSLRPGERKPRAVLFGSTRRRVHRPAGRLTPALRDKGNISVWRN